MKTGNGLDGILKECAHLMAKKGYRGTSMRMLARATGRSLAGLYHHFRSKQELLYLINHRSFTLLVTSAERIAGQELSAEERLYAVIASHVRFFNRRKDEMRVMLFGTQDLDAKRGQAISDLKDRYGALVQRVVRDVIQAKNGARLAPSELSRKTFLLFGMMNWIFGWYSPKAHGPEATLVNDIYLAFLRGMVAPRCAHTEPGLPPHAIEAIRHGLD